MRWVYDEALRTRLAVVAIDSDPDRHGGDPDDFGAARLPDSPEPRGWA